MGISVNGWLPICVMTPVEWRSLRRTAHLALHAVSTADRASTTCTERVILRNDGRAAQPLRFDPGDTRSSSARQRRHGGVCCRLHWSGERSMRWQEGNHKLVRQLLEESARRTPEAEAAQVAAFIEQYYDNFPLEELRGRSLSDLYAATYGHWRFLQYYDRSRPKVRVFNPEFEHHRWQLGHTVVTIVCNAMPFALDSVRAELNRRNITIYTIHGAGLCTVRGNDHRLQALACAAGPQRGDGEGNELLLYLEIDRHSDADALLDIERTLDEILREVALVVADFGAMLVEVDRARSDIATGAATADDIAEVDAFLGWLRRDFFTFLGYEYFRADDEGQSRCVGVEASRLGLLRLDAYNRADREASCANAPGDGQGLRRLIAFTKAAVRSRVHRRIHPDYVTVRVFDGNGCLRGEHRFLGMYTSRAYTLPAGDIPVVRRKLAEVMARSRFAPGSHEASELARVLEIHPRDELFYADADQLFEIVTGINRIQERRLVRLFVRRDDSSEFVSCLVFMPRDLYSTELRRRVQELLCEAFAASETEFTTFFSESVLTRTHFVLRVPRDCQRDVDVEALQREIVRLGMSWQDHLRAHLIEEFGEEPGLALAREYDDAFPAGYRDDYEPRAALADIRKLATLINDRDIAMGLYRGMGDPPQTLRFRLFHLNEPLALSDVMPILDNLGLRAIGERAYGVRRRTLPLCWIHEFLLRHPFADEIDVAAVGVAFQEAFARIWFGDAENDSFNRLILSAGLGWRDCAVLRAYARYLKQTQFGFSVEYIADTLTLHLPLTRRLVELFRNRFDPALYPGDSGNVLRREREEALRVQIIAALDDVDNPSHDRIIRSYMALILATLRTNLFQRDSSAQLKNYFSFKLLGERVPDLPLPRPLFEIFVHSPRVEGVHLRTSKVARGGLRWSDRLEDFRTEILGLVKAQNVKNSVIVPTGAKGGFVVRRPPAAGGREALQEEVVGCYRLFVQGLLDLTDNNIDGQVQPPPEVVRWDDDDPYLVVAADKGTASFSDIANDVARGYGFWLGDAFASGGSVGYDHKKMGITARGAWVSVVRHFRELGIDANRDPITVVGIGDMSGDVFGNGLLRSPQLRLVAAFNHQHIFIDPDPEPEASFAERQRLFELPRSSWEDYDAALISSGGGVFRRSLKSIAITPQMKKRFAIEADQLTPNELISALLRAPVDLLWNGGIGTYIKASQQSHAECSDKANDALRVDARELRCRVIGEGGNLGMTQLARVEYSLHGGRCNTDFIDNAGGVNCSDREVNIKIALNALVAAGDMTDKQRRELLAQMTDEVAALVLRDNERQTLAISLAARQSLERTGEYRRLIHRLEQGGYLNRALEFLPDDETLLERRALGLGLTRPELALLISYIKGRLKSELVDPLVHDDPLLGAALYQAFPAELAQRHPLVIEQHRLRPQIIATQVANDIVNTMGILFVDRMVVSTGASVPTVARAYVTVREVFGLHELWQRIERIPEIDCEVQLDMLLALIRLVRRGTRWLIRNRRLALDPTAEVARFRQPLAELYRELPSILRGRIAEDHAARRQQLLESGAPVDLADYVAAAEVLYPALGIIDNAAELGAPPRKVAEVHIALILQLDLDLFIRQINELKVESHWQALARESFRDDLEWQLRRLTAGAMRHLCEDGDVDQCIARWSERHQPLVQRWRALMTEMQGSDTREFAVYSVAIRELLDLAQSSDLDEL
jgi:glutamate dehydrogenase